MRVPRGMSLPPVAPWDGWPTERGPRPNWGGALNVRGRVSTVGTCISLTSRVVASFPIATYNSTGPTFPPTWIENPEPEIYSSRYEAIQALVNSLLYPR